jgi:hypothetical protein
VSGHRCAKLFWLEVIDDDEVMTSQEGDTYMHARMDKGDDELLTISLHPISGV